MAHTRSGKNSDVTTKNKQAASKPAKKMTAKTLTAKEKKNPITPKTPVTAPRLKPRSVSQSAPPKRDKHKDPTSDIDDDSVLSPSPRKKMKTQSSSKNPKSEKARLKKLQKESSRHTLTMLTTEEHEETPEDENEGSEQHASEDEGEEEEGIISDSHPDKPMEIEDDNEEMVMTSSFAVQGKGQPTSDSSDDDEEEENSDKDKGVKTRS
ncbi:hypothetical protein EWM64_g9121 [Hericium alpestre]|uniref:Uncharacterized protein n=1 Tax=Hericium alpestre TaxID=135208 RepID=A0A4Y9ZM34_9AGAM|nr:hypothetical protein EWM64_g9121 [Hericium alpestre]